MNEADRLTLLEERYAHLQRHIVEQDRAMLDLSEQVSKLRKELLVLRAQSNSGTSGPTEQVDERPPHY